MKLQDYLHYYIGANVFLCINLEGNNVIEPLTPKMLHEDMDMFIDPDDTRPYKLLLRRLEDMKEDQMIGLLQSMAPPDMEDKPTPEDYGLEMFYNDDGLMVDRDIAVGANYSCRCYEGQIGVKVCGSIILFDETGKDVTRDELTNTPRAFHYLLQQGFDLFGLIPAGLAIDAKTLQQ